ncbi:Na+/H+ antiporter NhaC [Metabacillus iocasae]|uniref:NhaC family Na+:H+ antiporter n=1 Tax=Priestia iocasae TaxID=2291674 RepID=A0ABS2QUC7_9BACI|nr:Na+/H+ antiporter NhaC [Metabacillus iocasae]MBM7703086.1 NhaC family Na+:H+ antiporter [Metabacillus iocasae]
MKKNDITKNEHQEQIDLSFGLAVIPLLVMIVAMAVTIIRFEGSPHIPLLVGTAIAAFIAWRKGYKWKRIEQGAYKGIRLALPAILIIILVGIIIGAWLGGGIVATMVYYGLMIISPQFFLVSIAIICAVVTLAIGSSWSTMGTIGVAGMGIGVSMGIPAPVVAGAIISGAYFGDKLSPLSDTTNLAAGIAGANLFEHIKYMLITTIPALLIALIVYGVMGRSYAENEMKTGQIGTIMELLQENFVISPWLLLVPLTLVVLVARRVPALPAIGIGILLGWICHVFVQGGSLGSAVNTLQDGFSISTGNDMVDELFNRGGIDDMMFTVSLVIVAMTFGGVMEHTGMLNAIVSQILKLATTSRRLVPTTVVSSIFTNIAAAEQYMSVVLPGRMYASAYEEKSLHPKNLSRALEDGGTVTSVFVPWNTCAVFIFSTLSVHPFEYGPYAILNYMVPIISIVIASMGIGITKMSKQQLNERKERIRKSNEQIAT